MTAAHKTQIKSRPGPLSSSTVVAPPFILPKLLRGTRDQWVVQVLLIIIYSTGLAPFPRLSAPPHSSVSITYLNITLTVWFWLWYWLLLLRYRQLRALDELQERVPQEIHEQSGQWPTQLPLLVPNRGGLQHHRYPRRHHKAQLPLEGCQRTKGEAGDLQTHRTLLHPLHAHAGIHHAGGPALLLRRQHEAYHPRQRGRDAQPYQHRVLRRPALQSGHPTMDPLQGRLEPLQPGSTSQ